MKTENYLPSGICRDAAPTQMGGVYAVSGVKDHKVYIGASTALARREQEHYSALKNGRHYNVKLQGAYEKYGRNNFVFLILQSTEDPIDMTRYEQEFINHYARNGNLYNICLVVPKTTNHGGYNLSEETRRRQSAAQTHRKIEQTRARLYRFFAPSGALIECFGLRKLCKRYRLNISHMSKVARGILRQHKGWRLVN